MLGRQVPVLLVAGLLLLVGVNVLMDQAPRTAPQPAAGSTEMLKRIRRDLVAQRGAMDGAPGAASGVAASQRAAAAASASATASGAASPIALPAPVIFRPPMPVPGPASDAARALAQANGGASKLPPPLNTLEPGTDIFVSFSSASMAPFALNWVANLRRAGINEVLVGALDAEMYSICESNGIPTLTIDGKAIADRHAANLRFDYSAYKQMAAMKVRCLSEPLRTRPHPHARTVLATPRIRPVPSSRSNSTQTSSSSASTCGRATQTPRGWPTRLHLSTSTRCSTWTF
jgi:hypothetical protein